MVNKMSVPHKMYLSQEELCLQAEIRFLDDFEAEVRHMLAEMPNLRSGAHTETKYPQPVASYLRQDTAPPPRLKRELGKVGRKVTDKALETRNSVPLPVAEKALKPVSSHPLPNMSMATPMHPLPIPVPSLEPSQVGFNTSMSFPQPQTIVSAAGLQLMVSVERGEEGGLGDEMGLEEEDELNVEEMAEFADEDVSVPDSAASSPAKNVIIGALANGTEEDMLKPKMECPTCGLVLYRHNFSTHYRIHTGEMPFNCSYCEKRFRTTSALKVHERVHTGEKPYQCTRCNYACITKRNLDRHIVNNHEREGTRRGPRYRRSRYRQTDPHHQEYLNSMSQEQEGQDHSTQPHQQEMYAEGDGEHSAQQYHPEMSYVGDFGPNVIGQDGPTEGWRVEEIYENVDVEVETYNCAPADTSCSLPVPL